MKTHVVEKFRPSRRAQIFNPVQDFTVPAGQSVVKEYRGLSGKEFGVNRFNIGCASPENILVKAVLNNELVLFQNVHLSALRTLFLHRSLLAPFIIRENNTLELTLTNIGSSTIDANVQLLGFDHVALAELRAFNERTGKVLPKPAFLFGHDTVNALTTRKRIPIQEKATTVVFARMALGSTIEADTRVSIDVNNDTIKKEVFLSQLNDEFLSMQALVPFEIGSRIPFDLLVTNKNNANAIQVSFIAEGYER